jgi:hypothetical protein
MFSSINFIQTELQAIKQSKENYGYNYKLLLLAPRRTALRVQVVILHNSAGLAHSQVRTAPQQKQIDHAPRSVRTHYYLSF